MQINITGHHVEVTPALRTYATEKLDRLSKRGDTITSVELIFDVEKVEQIAKATLHIAGAVFHASSTSGDLYSAIDLLTDKLNHQLTKHKEKIKNHHHPRERENGLEMDADQE
jgi:putative sigma-54 modulation protein